MPAKVSKTKSGKYQVKTPNSVHAKGTTKKKAEAQKKLLDAVDHGWKPGEHMMKPKAMPKGMPPKKMPRKPMVKRGKK